jgi:hypothetical protein
MRLIKEDFEKETLQAWKTYLDALEKSIDKLEKDIDEASAMSSSCTSEWCEATEHVIDELSNALFSISEPRWTSQAMSQKLKQLKRRVYDLYANYRAIPKPV